MWKLCIGCYKYRGRPGEWHRQGKRVNASCALSHRAYNIGVRIRRFAGPCGGKVGNEHEPDRKNSAANRVVTVCGSGGSLCLGRVSATVGIPERLRVSTHIGVITETIVSGIH